MHSLIATLCTAVLLTLISCSCAVAQKPAGKPKPQVVAAIPLTPAVPADVLQYVPDDVVMVGAIQPARLINSPGFRGLLEATKGQDVLDEILQQCQLRLGFNPAEIEEIAVILDRQTVTEMAEGAKKLDRDGAQLNQLKQIGLAMHNFHDVNSSFPDEDGIDDGNKGHLSWRVHLLPYVDQAELYEQFHMDEPWDSDHNKTLIEKIPEVFKTADVTEPGKTSVHVLAGTGMPFDGESCLRIAEITDGTSNTIMAVMAGADQSEIWTKPGALHIDAENPLASLGKVGPRFATVFMDGAVRVLLSETNADDLLHMMQHNDGHPINLPPHESYGRSPEPGIVVRCSTEIPQIDVLARLFPWAKVDTSREFGGQNARSLPGGLLVVFPNPQTMLIGSETPLKAMLEKRIRSGETKARFEAIYPTSDAALVANLEPLEESLPRLTENLPMAGMIQSLRHVQLNINLTGSGPSLNHMELTMKDAGNARQIAAIATGLYQMQKAELLAVASADNTLISAEASERLASMMDSTVIKADGVNVTVDTPRPEDGRELLKLMEPAFAELLRGIRSGREVASRSQTSNQLKQLALSLHNYHDAYNGLPSFNMGRGGQDANKGLSWRVHILPYLEEAALYNKFHLDEPWDSEHNKSLIEQMPPIFATKGVNKPGHTVFHVFTGEKTPFGGEKPIGFREITDGLSNTIMVVQAGPDTADVWTKPAGLKFDPENPKKALGQIGEQLSVVLCDGSVRVISGTIDDETLSRLIQHADGNPIDEF